MYKRGQKHKVILIIEFPAAFISLSNWILQNKHFRVGYFIFVYWQ